MEVKVVASLGTGLMSSQIALNSAKHGFKTYIWGRNEKSFEKFDKWLDSYLAGRIAKGKLTQEEADRWLANLTKTTSLEEAVKDADLIIESVLEDANVKRETILECNKYMKPSCIFGTNSSAMPSSMFADAMKDPSKLCNMHFFNPAMVMELVEVVMGPHTSQETADTVMEVSRQMGKDPICMKKEIDGFIVTRMLGIIGRAAQELVELGICTPQEYDKAMEKGCNHKMGAFRLMDLTGIDLACRARVEEYERTGDESVLPPKFLLDLYKAGHYGRKTGKGFYEYN